MHPSVIDSFGLMISGKQVSHYSPLVENVYQQNTSNINDWVEWCGTDKLEDCWYIRVNDFAMQKFRDATPGSMSYLFFSEKIDIEAIYGPITNVMHVFSQMIHKIVW